MVKYLCESSDFKKLIVKGKDEEKNEVFTQFYKKI